jgi:hypothetical protein
MHQNRISYLFYHMHFIYPNIKSLVQFMVFEKGGDGQRTANKIVFRQSSQPISDENFKWIDGLPVLYPLSDLSRWYHFDADNNLVFDHGLLQSAFYLLSAQQEQKGETDEWGRYQFNQSLQYKLDISLKPIVNEYFKIIGDGLAAYCQLHGIAFERAKPFSPFAFHLSHDIDRLYFHHPKEVANRFLQLTGMRTKQYSLGNLLKLLADDCRHIWHYKKVDSWWNFSFLGQQAKEHSFRPTFYFLPKTGNRLDSRYRLSDKRLINVYAQLLGDGFEVGLHMPLKHKHNYNCYLEELSAHTHQIKMGVRRHYLAVKNPADYRLDETLNIRYDSSFGFSEHPGFRNSYCLPFKPYDHANERMIDLWVIPLTAMDVTFLFKQKASFPQIEAALNEMAAQAERFGGLVSLLWHNCRFDEVEFPGITQFYRRLLLNLAQKKAQGMPGLDIVQQMDNLENSTYSTFMNFFNKGLTSNE